MFETKTRPGNAPGNSPKELLSAELKAIAREHSNCEFFGHGTDPESARDIMKEGLGLGANSFTIDMTAKKSNLFGEAGAEVNRMANWIVHDDRKRRIMLLALPSIPSGVSQAYMEVLSEKQVLGSNADYGRQFTYRIPARYILGVVDADTMVLERNKAFSPTPGPVENSLYDLARNATFKNRPGPNHVAAPPQGLDGNMPERPAGAAVVDPDDWVF